VPQKTKKRRYPKLTKKEREKASRFIREEMHTGKYPREQAIAIGLSRARQKAKRSRIDEIAAKYL
jgi:hypothetical protein